MDYKIRPMDFDTKMAASIEKLRQSVNQQAWHMTAYAINRAQERGLSYDDVHHAVQNGRVVEFQYTKDSERLLLRDEYGTCVAFNLTTNCVVTVYHNDPSDNHATLYESNYITGYQLKLLQAHYMMLQEAKEKKI